MDPMALQKKYRKLAPLLKDVEKLSLIYQKCSPVEDKHVTPHFRRESSPKRVEKEESDSDTFQSERSTWSKDLSIKNVKTLLGKRRGSESSMVLEDESVKKKAKVETESDDFSFKFA